MATCSEKIEPVRCGCGGEAVIEYIGSPFSPYVVKCKKCGVRTDEEDTESEAIEAWNRAMGATSRIIHCSECAHWMDRCVLMNDGRIRQYKAKENFVTISEGINEGAKCLHDERCIEDGHAIFREADDFCSKAEKRPSSYEEWYGIKDGIYAKRWKDE